MKTYNIIIGVIASRSKIYDDFVKYYWSRFIEYINKKNYSIKIYLLYGDDYENIFNISQEHIFITDINDSFIPGCLKKTISFFEYIKKNYKFNYIFRTNLSSFIIIDNFIKLINSFPKKKIICWIIS